MGLKRKIWGVRERARTVYRQGKAVNEARKNPYKTASKLMLPIIVIMLLAIIVGFFAIKAGAALLIGKETAKRNVSTAKAARAKTEK